MEGDRERNRETQTDTQTDSQTDTRIARVRERCAKTATGTARTHLGDQIDFASNSQQLKQKCKLPGPILNNSCTPCFCNGPWDLGTLRLRQHTHGYLHLGQSMLKLPRPILNSGCSNGPWDLGTLRLRQRPAQLASPSSAGLAGSKMSSPLSWSIFARLSRTLEKCFFAALHPSSE